MNNLIETHNNLIEGLNNIYKRHLNIDWNDKLIGITGARGVGKTTFLISHIKDSLKSSDKALYISLDDLYFSKNNLLDTTDEWVKRGGTHLFLDEVHKYENWSQELKNIYDRYKNLKVIFTGSSALHLYRGSADLSRRAVLYNMNGFSFREYLNVITKKDFRVYSLDEILSNHENICKEIISKVKPFEYFDDYLKYGYYPFFMESTITYNKKLLNTINLILEIDLPHIKNVDVKYIHKLKKLLYIVATSVPYQPNISKLSSEIEVARNTIMLYLNYLEDSKILSLLHTHSEGDSYLSKPEKVYLHHPNLMYAINGNNINLGTVRETFFLNQLKNIYPVSFSKSGDFIIDNKNIFEVGGKNKNFKQLKDVPNSFVAADMIELGFGNKIPLWLFGFLY